MKSAMVPALNDQIMMTSAIPDQIAITGIFSPSLQPKIFANEGENVSIDAPDVCKK